LYNWDQWAMRVYIRDALLNLFPQRAEEIYEHVDPGEYGIESYWCRFLCCALFMMAVMNDLFSTIQCVYLNYYVPTSNESWLVYKEPHWAPPEYAKAVHDWSELDLVRIRIAGIPMKWKIINYAFVAFPKFALWLATANAGTNFLMETSTIENLIINSIALTFILSIDELICENFTSPVTLYLLDRLDPFPLYDDSEDEHLTDADHVAKVMEEQQWRWHFWELIWDVLALIPVRLVMTVFLTVWFVGLYYVKHCQLDDDNAWVSDSMFLPKLPEYSLLTFWFPSLFPLETESKPFWTMEALHLSSK
jgi:hypothetical protein